jgi:hypothetical protein
VKTLESKEKEITARVAANIKAGNRQVAGQLALELQTIKSQLEENRGQLTVSEETYKKLIKTRDVSIKDAKAKIETLKRMLSEAEMMEAQAELQEMASGMIGQIGGSGDTLNRVEEYLTERRDKAAGRSRVASSTIDTTEIQMKESEQVALADQALADFEMAYGMKAPEAEKPAAAEPQIPNRELGPKQSN